MNRLFLVLIVFIVSCKSKTEREKLLDTLSGNWLIIAPEKVVNSEKQRTIYRRLEDSLVGLRSLKLISLSDDGSFQQMDSVDSKGKWSVSEDKVLTIKDGGAGFEDYTIRYTDFNKGSLKLTGFIQAQGESIKLIWTLKKVTGSDASDLFSKESNEWRRRPAKSESAEQMRKRLSDMLNYYSDYYSLVTKEASFFVPVRVILPFHFYQHSMGMKDFDKESAFARVFNSPEQADEAYGYLAETMLILKDDFPSDDNFIKEYAAFMKKMANKITKLK